MRSLYVLIAILVTSSLCPAQEQSRPSREQLAKEFRSIVIESSTVHMRAEVMQAALQERPEFEAWDLELVKAGSSADTKLHVTRQLMTFDFPYELVDQRYGVVIVAGKVVARDGLSAAKEIAKDLCRRLAKYRPLPESVGGDAEKPAKEDKAPNADTPRK